MRNVHKLIVRKLEGKRPLGRPTHRRQNTIKMDLEDIWCEGVE